MKLENLPQDTIVLTGRIKHKSGFNHPLVGPGAMVKAKWTEIQLDYSRLNGILGHCGKPGSYVFFGIPYEEVGFEL